MAYLLLVPVFALAPYPLLSGFVLLLTGVANACFSIMQATLVYLSAPPEMRSRVYGVLSVCIGIGMFGFILIGVLAGLIGAAWATAATGGRGHPRDAADPALVASARRPRLRMSPARVMAWVG